MANLSYQRPGLALQAGVGTREQIRDLQRDLRALGYLASGVDGVFGSGTTRAVKALQYDLLANHGRTRGSDGDAPVAVTDYKVNPIAQVTGIADQATVACIAAMLDDPTFPKLPSSSNPKAENAKIVAQVAALPSTTAPIPYLLGILQQESGLKHFCEPSGSNQDSFIVLGCDTNASEKYIITSRGYGVGQYTLFHHPPRAEEIADFMLDPARNVQKAVTELREKFDHFVNGPTPGTQASDRRAEAGNGPLRLCQYQRDDPRYLKDCKACLQNAGLVQINQGDPVFAGSNLTLQPTPNHRNTKYERVPQRKNIPCDWPYAVRRYNGSGIDSYHYQFRVLQRVLNFTAPAIATAADGGDPA